MLCIYEPLVLASEVPKIPQHAYRWRIRGKTATAWLYGAIPVEKIFLTPIEGSIDTIFYQKKLAADTSQWQYYLTRISVEGNYEGYVGSCCDDLNIHYSKDRFSGKSEVQFKLTSSDGKMYLGRLGNNGVMLKEGTVLPLDNPCYNSPVGNRNLYPYISIEEIDTSETCRKKFVTDDDGNLINAEKKGTIELRDLVCINSNWFDQSGDGTYSYCRKRSIIEFPFMGLDDKPLIVVFDAKSQKVFLR